MAIAPGRDAIERHLRADRAAPAADAGAAHQRRRVRRAGRAARRSSSSSCSTPDRSRRAGRSPTCCCATVPAGRRGGGVGRQSRRRRRLCRDAARRAGAHLRADGVVAGQDRPDPRTTAPSSSSRAIATPTRSPPARPGRRRPVRCRCTRSISWRRFSARARSASSCRGAGGRCSTRVLVAVGGGGLIAGIAAWYRGDVRVIGVEPRLAPTLFDALAAGRPVDAPAGGVAADSLAPRRVGELMFPIAKAFVERVVLVEDDDILRAQAALWDAARIVAEPGGATAMAALAVRRVSAGAGRARRRHRVRRQHDGGALRPPRSLPPHRREAPSSSATPCPGASSSPAPCRCRRTSAARFPSHVSVV